jgi:hypothetical protein
MAHRRAGLDDHAGADGDLTAESGTDEDQGDLGEWVEGDGEVSIPAEIMAHTDQVTGLPLRQATGTIHRPILQRRPVAVR